MRNLVTLFLIFVIVSASVKDSNATTVDRLIWTAGSAVNVTFGPEDAVYCRLKDNKGTTVFDGFGPCRVVLDRVKREHRGSWELLVGAPGTVIVRRSWVNVDVVAVDSTLAVTTSAVNNYPTVILTCSVPEEYQVQSCTFRDPSGTVFIASPGVGQDESEDNATRYESYAEDNSCKLTLVRPSFSRHMPIWRCAVNTIRGTSYGFVTVPDPPEYPGYTDYSVPELKVPGGYLDSTDGEAFTVSCYIGAPIRYCYFRAPNGTVFNVGPSTSSVGYEYVGNGFDAGECGIRFNNIWTSATTSEDLWSCNVGLTNNSYFEEKSAFFDVYIYERLRVYSIWEGSAVVVRIFESTGNEVEYCRLVRSDGLGFVSKQAPFPYILEVSRDESCTLFIPRPVAEDLRPWTVVVKVSGEDEELSVTTTLVPPPQSTGLSRTASTVLWCLFGTIFVFLILASFLPKKNREWTHQRAVRIRNSFRRQPQPQPQSVVDLPNPVHTDILTDLPRKV